MTGKKYDDFPKLPKKLSWRSFSWHLPTLTPEPSIPGELNFNLCPQEMLCTEEIPYQPPRRVNLMSYLHVRSLVLASLPLSGVLSGCEAKPECDSIETRTAVLNIVSNDHGNALVAYAARNFSANKDDAKNSAEENKSAGSDKKPLYLLGQKIVTTSTSEDRRTLQCSGGISVAVGDLKATKEVNFTVQKSSDAKISVSVAPFQF